MLMWDMIKDSHFVSSQSRSKEAEERVASETKPERVVAFVWSLGDWWMVGQMALLVKRKITVNQNRSCLDITIPLTSFWRAVCSYIYFLYIVLRIHWDIVSSMLAIFHFNRRWETPYASCPFPYHWFLPPLQMSKCAACCATPAEHSLWDFPLQRSALELAVERVGSQSHMPSASYVGWTGDRWGESSSLLISKRYSNTPSGESASCQNEGGRARLQTKGEFGNGWIKEIVR